MRRAWGCTLLVIVVGIGFMLAAPAAERKKTTGATAEDYSRLTAGSTLLGKLVLVNSNRSFLLQVEYEYFQPYGGRKGSVSGQEALIRSLSQEQQKLLKEQEKILKIRNPVKRLQELQRFVAQQQAPGHAGHQPRGSVGHGPSLRVVKARKNYDLQAIDAVKVRTLELPTALDAKGNPRKLTDAEKRALKGPNQELPGYTSHWSRLKPDLMVRVYFAPKRKSPTTDAAKTRANDHDKDDGEDPKPQVSMIVILDEDDAPAAAGKKKN